MATQKQVNMAENQLVVGSIKVLNDISGGGIDTIKQTTQAISQSVTVLANKTDDYWSEIASDKVITPSEKKTLKKELAGITRTHAAIMSKAEEKGIETLAIYVTYNANYTELYNYLNTTLKLFADMTVNTKIDNYDTFISKYESYYESEEYAREGLAGIATATVRTLQSLNETGTEAEIAYFRGTLYRYTSGVWVLISANNYKGTYGSSTPDPVIGDYFLCSNDFSKEGFAFYSTKGFIASADGKLISITKTFTKGYIYEYTYERGWKLITDKNDYRYLIALNDIVAMNGEVSPGLSSYVNDTVDTAKDELQEKIDEANENSQALIDAAEANGNYLGVLTADPTTNLHWGDYYLYNGTETSTRIVGALYKYSYSQKDASTESEKWLVIDPSEENSNGYKYYMAALRSAKKVSANAPIGIYSTILAELIVAQDALINKIQTSMIILKEGGCLQSENYKSDPSTEDYAGFKFDYNGYLEAYDGIFRGSIQSGPLSIDMAKRDSVSLSWDSGTEWRTIRTNLKSNSIFYSTYNVTGTRNSKTMKQVTITQITGTSTYTVSSEYHYDPEYGTHVTERCAYTLVSDPVTYRIVIKYEDLSYETLEGIITDKHYEKMGADYYGTDARFIPPSDFWKAPPSLLIYESDTISDQLAITFTGDEKVVKLLNIPTSSSGYSSGTLWSDGGTLKIIP